MTEQSKTKRWKRRALAALLTLSVFVTLALGGATAVGLSWALEWLTGVPAVMWWALVAGPIAAFVVYPKVMEVLDV